MKEQKHAKTITPNQLVLKTQNVLKYGVVNVCDMYGKARSEHINVCGKGQWLVSDRLPGKCENCHHSKRTLPEFSKMTDAVLEKSFSYWQLQLLYLFKKSHEAWETNFTTSQDWKTIRNICIYKYIDSLSLSLSPSPSLTHYTHTIYIT